MKSTLTAPAPTPATSFRLYLQSELARRCARNDQYSMRAFAAHLDVDHSTLSQWLRGRRPITPRAIAALAPLLGLEPEAIDRYVEHSARERDLDRCRGGGLLSPETVALIADWHHFAILELTRLADFQPDSRWIARVLDIAVDEVNVALQRLIRLDLLDLAAADRWVDRSGDASVSLDHLDPVTVERRAAQSALLAASALRAVPMTLRDQTAITMAISSAALPRAIELVARFRRELVALLQDGAADDVYQLEIALFPVTTMKREGAAS
jgi:transcriptional regulator with XRE-family HTH domain